MQNNDDLPGENLNNDDDIKMENELLRLKLLAELGADTNITENLDPTIENLFLKQIIAFEKGYTSAKKVKIYDLLERPGFEPAKELSEDSVTIELKRVITLLSEKNIDIAFLGNYSDFVKYSFIVEELFNQEVDDFNIPGMMMNFIYEEFHPNHQLDINNRADEFLLGWFKQTLSENNLCLSDTFVLPDRRLLSKSEVAKKLKDIFDSYITFANYEYAISAIDFQGDFENGMGYAEGRTKYDAVIESGERIVINGPFKLYFECQHGWWSIFHIVFPGFDY
jgi:hypothetical protein